MTTKLKSFTLSEIIVVMVISMIVIGLSYSILSLVNSQMEDIKEINATQTAFHRFHGRIQNDIQTFTDHSLEANGTQLIFKNPIREKIYYFYPDQVISELDTFYLGSYSLTTYLKNTPVNQGAFDAIYFHKTTSPHLAFFIYSIPTSKLKIENYGYRNQNP